MASNFLGFLADPQFQCHQSLRWSSHIHRRKVTHLSAEPSVYLGDGNVAITAHFYHCHLESEGWVDLRTCTRVDPVPSASCCSQALRNKFLPPTPLPLSTGLVVACCHSVILPPSACIALRWLRIKSCLQNRTQTVEAFILIQYKPWRSKANDLF